MTASQDFTFPFKAYAAGLERFLELSQASQNMAIDALQDTASWQDKALKESGETVKWPQMTGVFPANPEQMREAFHKLANLNLQRWEKTAELLKAMPMWTRLPNQMTGRLLTDWFDKAHRHNPFLNPEDEQGAPASDEGRVAAGAVKAAKPVKAKKTKKAKPKKTKKASPKPKLLKAPRGAVDDLTEIKGIGPVMSQQLNAIGVYHFSQIADWNKANASWIDDKLMARGRIQRENWVKQAQSLTV